MSPKGLLDERKSHLAELRREREAASDLSVEKLAAEIRRIGFDCICCGECCVGEDNSVVVFPFEIRHILKATGRPWLDVALPPFEGEWDARGNFHTLEWRIKKEGGSCKFYAEGCRIYEARPLLCMTYPFYLDEGILRFSQCRGLGGKIGVNESEEIAARLIKRYVTEITEAIALLERYEDFERGLPSMDGACIVHDSEGKHLIAWEHLPDFKRRCQEI